MSINVQRDTDYIIGHSKTCGNRQKEFALWIPVIQGNSTDIDGQYQWIDDRSGSPNNIVQNLKWSRSEPNGYELEKCVVARVKETKTGKQKFLKSPLCRPQRQSLPHYLKTASNNPLRLLTRTWDVL